MVVKLLPGGKQVHQDFAYALITFLNYIKFGAIIWLFYINIEQLVTCGMFLKFS